MFRVGAIGVLFSILIYALGMLHLMFMLPDGERALVHLMFVGMILYYVRIVFLASCGLAVVGLLKEKFYPEDDE